MATVERPREKREVMVKEMSWDPITRIVGSLGIHTEIDFANQEVLKCYSTSMVLRGFDIFMKGTIRVTRTSSPAGSAGPAATTTAPRRA